MEKKKGIAVVFLLAFFMGVLAGCGQEEYRVEYGIDGYVYLSQRISSMKGAEDLRVIGDYLYYMQYTDDVTTVQKVLVASLAAGENKLDFSGKTVAEFRSITFELPEGADESGENIDFLSALNGSVKQSGGIDMKKRYGRLTLERYAVAPDGTIYLCLSAWAGEIFDMDIVGGVLCRQNLEGEQIYQIYLPGIEILDFAANTEGRGMVLTGEGIRVLGLEGNQEGFISTQEYHAEGNERKEELFTDSEGRVYYSIVNSRYVRTTYEIAGKGSLRLENAGGFLGKGNMNHAAAPGGNVFLFSPETEGILYYDRKKDSGKQLLNWSESGLINNGILSVAGVTSDILLVSYDGFFGGQSGIYQLTKTPVEELPEKELLVIAAPLNSLDLQKAVMLFNASSDSYRVVLESYGAEYSDAEGCWVCPQLDASLVSANPPDMLDMGTLNIVKYAKKGVLEDISPYLEGSSLDKGDILDNLLEGLTFDGKLVSIPLTFEICSVTARAAQVESFDSWTMEDVYRLAEMYPESIGGMVDDGYGQRAQRAWLLEEFCSRYYLEKFIDWEKYECSFDSDEFRNLIAWAGKYGWEPEHAEVQMGDITLARIYIPEDVLLVSQWWMEFTTLAQLEMQYGEEVCLKGYPTVDGSGYFPARIRGGLGINANSPHKEAAWEFIEYYLQVNSESMFINIPASKTKISRRYENVVTPNYYNGADGETKMEKKGVLVVGSDTLPYYSIDKEQADAILNAVETADFTPMSEEEEMIIYIVLEESESYYNGDKSLEEVTDLIQNRVQLLLNERK